VSSTTLLIYLCLFSIFIACSEPPYQKEQGGQISKNDSTIVSAEDTNSFAYVLARQRMIEKRIEKNESFEATQNVSWIGIFGILLLGLGFSIWKLRQLHRSNIILAHEKELITEQAERDLDASKKREKILSQKLAESELVNKMLNIRNQLIIEDETVFQGLLKEAEQISRKENFDTEGVKFVTNDDWQRFREQFDKAFPNFSFKLKTEFSQLSQSDTRLFMLIKIGLDNGGIANALGISVASVYTSRYRLRKKLELKEDIDLESFIENF
jgi:hypothetical protein